MWRVNSVFVEGLGCRGIAGTAYVSGMLNFNDRAIYDATALETSCEGKSDFAVGTAEITKFSPTGGTNYHLQQAIRRITDDCPSLFGTTQC